MTMGHGRSKILTAPRLGGIGSVPCSVYAHRIMWQDTLKYVSESYMPYADFLAELGKVGLSIRAFAALVGMNPNSISNYARAGEVPAHLALIAVLIAGVHDLGGDYRSVMSKVAPTPKKARGGARKGRFGGDPQSSLDFTS